MNVEAAARSVFCGLAASGWHTAALTIKLLVESDLNIAGDIEVFEWPQPVRAGDTLTVRSEVLDVSNSRSRAGAGYACAAKR